MTADDIFAGPIVRRAQEDMVAIWIATRKNVLLEASVRGVGDQEWAGTSIGFTTMPVHPNLFVTLLLVTPPSGKKFPANRLLEYSLGVVNESDGEVDHAPFLAIVEEDELAYLGFDLPTFYLQQPGQKLTLAYASCRKPHDDPKRPEDAMAFLDDHIAAAPVDLSRRPAILCLLGDQIYADDVHDDVFDQILRVAKEIAADITETLPKGMDLPGKGARAKFVENEGGFTANSGLKAPWSPYVAKNHLVTHAEYAAMYGLAWSPRNWEKRTYPPDVQGYIDTLPKVRRLLANTPTYMIFDDHDVTDDWFFSVKWKKEVWEKLLGRRIVGNGLSNYWLFQAWGNDPDVFAKQLPWLQDIYGSRQENLRTFPNELDLFFWTLQQWEFYTPTYPFIYFLNTRTARGPKDGFKNSNNDAPAFLKTPEAWKQTFDRLKTLRSRISREYPLVLVAPAPVFGFETIDALQAASNVPLGPYPYDLEGWAANKDHLITFLLLLGDLEVILLSGDVHYAFSSTARFTVFDSDYVRAKISRFPNWDWPAKPSGTKPTYKPLYTSTYLQLTSSAAHNYASGFLAFLSTGSDGPTFLMHKGGSLQKAEYKDGKVHFPPVNVMGVNVPTPALDAETFGPICGFAQRYNDAHNISYLSEHNAGIASIDKRAVENFFLVRNGKSPTFSWTFANSRYWPGDKL